MTFAQTSGIFTVEELAIINYCRLYLHVTTVSELLDATGTSIIPEIFAGKREPWFNPESVITLQQRPSEYQIRSKWQKLCRQWTTSSGGIGAPYQMGNWLVAGHMLRRRRQSYIALEHQHKLYFWRETTYGEYHQDPNDSTCYRYSHDSNWLPTSHCTPITAFLNPDGTLRVPRQPRSPLINGLRTPSTTTFFQHIQSLKKWEQFLLEGVQMHFQPFKLLHYLQQHTEITEAIAVSDGSKRDDNTTY